MALLHYWNLGLHRPDIVMRNSFYGLRDFYEFLKRTEDYMKSPEAVLRLAWKLGEPPEGEKRFVKFIDLSSPISILLAASGAVSLDFLLFALIASSTALHPL